jgi:hypothetical protein
MNSYPDALIPVIKAACSGRKAHKFHQPPSLPPDNVARAFLDVAYHASFESEEGRRPGFRLILCEPSDREEMLGRPCGNPKYYAKCFRLVLLDRERPFSVGEINRLAPAAELTRLLICVRGGRSRSASPKLYIWALLDVGEAWWKFVHNEVNSGMPPPNFLTVSSTGPGDISVSAQGEVLASLRAGRIAVPTEDALWTGPLSDFLDPARNQLYSDVVAQLGTKKFDPDGADNDYPRRFYTFFLERLLFQARQRAQGGTVIMVPNHLVKEDTRLTDRANIKYPSQYDFAWALLVRSLLNHQRFYALHFPLWDAKQPYTQDSFQDYTQLAEEQQEIDDSLSDVTQAIASLTSVDGAVIINQRFDLLGFGAEVIASSPSLSHVKAITGSNIHSLVPFESFGTHHRSAFRFCSSLEESVAFVLSHDGGVKAVKRHGADVLLWPNINAGAMGI